MEKLEFYKSLDVSDEDKILMLSKDELSVTEVIDILRAKRRKYSCFKNFLIDEYCVVLAKIDIETLIKLLILSEEYLTLEQKLKIVALTKYKDDARILNYFS